MQRPLACGSGNSSATKKPIKLVKQRWELGVFQPIQALPFSGVMALFRHGFAELLKIKVISFPNCLLSGRGLKQPACGLHQACEGNV